ncbi:MAG: MFS transporter, partial [Pseudomonadota bacterium]|nr:MFS transporter [Pseudomonadota bacterium]
MSAAEKPASNASMVELTGWQSLKATFREPNYRVFTIGNIASLVGTWVQRITIGWLAWELTESGTWLGAVAFADLFPMVIVTPLAGAFADRADRLMTTRISQALLMVQAGALFLLTALGMMTIGVLLGLTLFGGIVTAFNQPARMALLPNLVDRRHLPTAIAINSIVFNTARFLGPMLAGVILVSGNVALAFLLNFVTFGAFLVALMRIRLSERDATDLTDIGLFSSLMAGLRYVRGHFGLAAMLLTLASSAIFVRPILELLPGYTDEFGLDVEAFALFTSVVGAGAVAGAVWLSLYGSPRLLTRLALLNGFLLSGALILAAATSSIA